MCNDTGRKLPIKIWFRIAAAPDVGSLGPLEELRLVELTQDSPLAGLPK
jgi:hypothetical protein